MITRSDVRDFTRAVKQGWLDEDPDKLRDVAGKLRGFVESEDTERWPRTRAAARETVTLIEEKLAALTGVAG